MIYIQGISVYHIVLWERESTKSGVMNKISGKGHKVPPSLKYVIIPH